MRIALLTVMVVMMTAFDSSGAEVVLETNKGAITLKLFADKAPITVENFLKYVDDGFYDGLVFHRVIADFMIQGGGFSPDLKQKQPRATIKNEAANGLSNKRGTIAMARTSVVDSATSQFFINVKDNRSLDHTGNNPAQFGYCVFGEVTSGMDVVDTIRNVKTHTPGNPPGMGDVPVEPVIITKARRK